MKNTTAAAKSKTTSYGDSWGTPAHEAAMKAQRQGHVCRDVASGRQCSHLISDQHLAAMRKVWR